MKHGTYLPLLQGHKEKRCDHCNKSAKYSYVYIGNNYYVCDYHYELFNRLDNDKQHS